MGITIIITTNRNNNTGNNTTNNNKNTNNTSNILPKSVIYHFNNMKSSIENKVKQLENIESQANQKEHDFKE